MVNKFKTWYFIFIVLFCLLLGISSFWNPQVYYSTFFYILYFIFAVFMIGSAFWIRGFIRKLVHIMLGLLIIGFSAEKLHREEKLQFAVLGTGGEYSIYLDSDTLNLELTRFEIESSSDTGSVPVQYTSYCRVNGGGITAIQVNRPLEYKGYKLYQYAVRNVHPIRINYRGESIKLFPGQSGIADSTDIYLESVDVDMGQIRFRLEDVPFTVRWGCPEDICGSSMMVKPLEAETATVLQIVPVKGHMLLWVMSVLILIGLGIDLMRRKD